MEPGTKATLTGMGGGPCEVVRVVYTANGIAYYVRVRMTRGGSERTVSVDRLRITPGPTVLGGDYVPDAADMLAESNRSLTLATEDMRAKLAEAREKGLVDWRSRPTSSLPGSRPIRQRETRLVSERYLAYVRRHVCCRCGTPSPSEAHHWSHHGGVMGAKVDDYRTVPLCTPCHRHWHDHGTLPMASREASEALFMETQVSLVSSWIGSLAVSPDVLGGIVDALVDAMRRLEQ